MATFQLELVTPDKMLFSGPVDQVDVPGVEGDFGVLAGHAPLIALIRPGIMTVYAGGEQTKLVVLGGFAEVSPTGLTVLADAASPVDEVDRTLIAARIEELASICAEMAPSAVRDREIEKLDSFRTLERSLQGATAH